MFKCDKNTLYPQHPTLFLKITYFNARNGTLPDNFIYKLHAIVYTGELRSVGY